MKGSELSRKAIKYLEQNYNAYVVNVVVAGKSGTADLLACIDGNFYAFEIKGVGDVGSILQDETFNKVHKAKGYGGYVRCLQDIDHIVTNKRLAPFTKPSSSISL